MENTSTVLMVQPVHFGFNDQTASSNVFQNRGQAEQDVQHKALKEFDLLVETLRLNGVEVLVFKDTPSPHTPDSIFPNNWFSTHKNGDLYLYPMEAENRRQERREDIISFIKERFSVKRTIDLSYFEKENKFLEGTGSMVLDRRNKIAYACLSSRTNPEVLKKFSELSGYRPVVFCAVNKSGQAIYHTNVMMSMGQKFVLACLDSVKDEEEKKNILASVISAGKEMIPISPEQMNHFAGNMLELRNRKGENLFIMSEQAFRSLSEAQIMLIDKYCRIICSPLETIEKYGGGSARCMIAEIYLSKKEKRNQHN